MKNLTNGDLLKAFIISTVISILGFVNFICEITIFFSEIINGLLAIIFSIVPWFFLQLLLCRILKKRWLKAVPVTILGIITAFLLINLINSTGLYAVGVLFLLLFCIGPLVGCIIALILNIISNRKRKKR